MKLNIFYVVLLLSILSGKIEPQSSSSQNSLSQTISFTKSPQTFPSAETFQVKLGDTDMDGDLDAIFSNMGFNNSKIWLNDGGGYFTDSGQLLTRQGHGVGFADLDNDTDPDLFISCAIYVYNGQFHYRPSKIYFNTSGNFSDSGQNLGDSLESKTYVDIIDIDCDGDNDAIVQHFTPPHQIYYKSYINSGIGNFVPGNLVLPDNSFPNFADLNDDGYVDIFLQQEGVGYSVLLNDGTGAFTTHWSVEDLTVTFNEKCVNLNDFDNDGDIDAFVISGGLSVSGVAKIFFNDGQGAFYDSNQELGQFNWCWVGSGDLDQDNDLDVVISTYGKPIEIWINDGSGFFTDSNVRLGGNNPYHGLDLGDLDGDGDLDIFVAYFGQGSNEVWFNNSTTDVNDDSPSKNFLNRPELFQNYPNPFNPTTKISFQIPEPTFITLKVFDVMGEEIETLIDEERLAGNYEVGFDGTGLSSGIYFYALFTDYQCITNKMIFIK
jgi:hypothetical protein